MVLAKVLLNKLTKAELALLCDAIDDSTFEFDIVPELIERDAENRPATYGMTAHELERAKTKDEGPPRKKGMKPIEL